MLLLVVFFCCFFLPRVGENGGRNVTILALYILKGIYLPTDEIHYYISVDVAMVVTVCCVPNAGIVPHVSGE